MRAFGERGRERGRERGHERGSALVVVTGLALCLAAFMGLVADTGVLALEKARLQGAADAAALAGALALPGGLDLAERQARTYVEANGGPSSAAVEFPSEARVRVAVDQTVPLIVPMLLGGAAQRVSAASTAETTRLTTPGARPFAIPDSSFVAGGSYVLKAGPQSGQQGNYRALAIDSTGTPAYVEAINQGAIATVSVGEWLSTEPGNMAEPTEEAVQELVATTSAAVGRVVAEHPACSADAVCDLRTCPRVVIAVLVDPLTFYDADGRKPVLVTGFSRFYLTGTSGNGEVYGQFLERFTADRVPGRKVRTVSRLID